MQCQPCGPTSEKNEDSSVGFPVDTLSISSETDSINDAENRIEKQKESKAIATSPGKGLTCDQILELYRKDLKDFFTSGQDWDKVKRRLPLNDIILKQCMEKNGDPFYAIEDSLKQIYKKRNK